MNSSENPSKIRKICVYCGSGAGTDPAFVEAARDFGEILAKNGIGLVFGGGGDGLMGALGHAALSHGGSVTGIIPEFLVRREHAAKLTQELSRSYELVVTRNLHERKHLMFERADAFVALPGGVGTLEELVEQMTWVQLGRHRKPIVIANIKGFWNPLTQLLQHMKTLGFIHSERLFNHIVVDGVQDILPAISDYLKSDKSASGVQSEAIERL
jgi:uncharacterized protein (TIGR00730 family)